MGLDIFFYLTKFKADSVGAAYNEDKIAQISKLKAVIAKRTARLTKPELENDEERYNREYLRLVEDLKSFTNYEFTLDVFRNDILHGPKLTKALNDFVRCSTLVFSAYFRKVNFIYGFFEDFLEDESCFVTKEQLEDLALRCDNVLKDKSLASELLPTRAGFFFGNTEYDKRYFRGVEDCRKQMGVLLRKMKSNPELRCFVIMDW